ncbi:MAG: diguanylate cyclase, partial [Holophagales bacterium]|nr:diguanylate cyclase [Holophagales bacterium]
MDLESLDPFTTAAIDLGRVRRPSAKDPAGGDPASSLHDPTPDELATVEHEVSPSRPEGAGLLPATTDPAADLFAELHRFRCALSVVSEAVLVLDLEARVEDLNPAAWELLAIPREEALGQPFSELGRLVDAEEQTVDLEPCLRRGLRLTLGYATLFERADGEVRQVEGQLVPILGTAPASHGRPDPRVVGAVVALRDVSDRHRLTQKLTRAARFDSLTGLLNREGFQHHLSHALKRAKARSEARQGRPGSTPGMAASEARGTVGPQEEVDVLCYMDLDQFQVVNDTCGHAAGDMLVQWIASLVRERLRDADVLGRLGGDEFGLLVRSTTLEGAEQLAAEIHSALSHFRFVWQDKSFSVGASIGMVPVTAGFDGLGDVSGAASQACALAKQQGRGRTRLYEPDADEVRRHQGQMNWVVRLRQALDERLFELHWQRIAPIRPLVSDGPLFFEVLVRLRSRDGTLHLPGEFLPAAERFDLMPSLDRWVVGRTLDLLQGQSTEFLDALDGVTLNLSGVSIGDERVFDAIHEHLDRTGFPGQKLCFEITETAAVSNLSRAVEMIEQLRRRRCRWALDDFGSG